MSIRYLYVTSVQEDKTMYFSNSLKWASGLQERHTKHLNGLAAFILPHFSDYNTVFCDTNDWPGQNN